jgi:hypothetical protein
MVWEPNEPHNPYGHAAIQTNTYHMSLWPDGDCKENFGYSETLLAGVKGSLIFHHQRDYELEGKREPLQYNIEYCSMKEVNELYEEMLGYNDITPDKVTLDRGNELITQSEHPDISLKKSQYSYSGMYLKGRCFIFQDNNFIGKLLNNIYYNGMRRPYEPIRDFYKYKQSCTTFCMNLLLNTGAFDPKYNLHEEITRMGFLLKEDFSDGGLLRVPNFKTIIEKKFNLTADCIIS